MENDYMAKEKLPKQYLQIKKRHKKYFNAVEELGTVIRQEGPLDERTAHLIQLAAAATVHSEGAVHSHVRRAINAGVTPEEIHHAIILLTSTIGFPTVVAALSWAEDVIKAKKK
jgi:AhpD family alkylhydroperoxidase